MSGLVSAVDPVTVPRWPLRMPRSRSLRGPMTRSPSANARPAISSSSWPSRPCALSSCAGAVVEVADVGAARGDHDRFAFRAGPVVNQRRTRVAGVVGDRDAPMLAIGACPALDVAAAQRGQRVAVPRLALPAHLSQLERIEVLGEGVEGAAGVDLRQLAVVADQHQLRVGLLGGLREQAEVAGPDHAGLVDTSTPSRGRLRPCSRLALRGCDGDRADAGLVFELERCARRQRAADHGGGRRPSTLRGQRRA